LGTALGIDWRMVAKSQKVYFYDLGVCNAILRALPSLELRSDAGPASGELLYLGAAHANVHCRPSNGILAIVSSVSRSSREILILI
jgi:hypothetical protein